MTDATQKDELEAEIRTFKPRKRQDGITNDMILQLGPSAKKAILALLTNPGSQAPFQLCGKKATIIPIYKKGKDKKHPSSYRPIVAQERIINTILMAHLEANNILSPTEDQLALLAQEIENAFQEKKKTVAVFYDLYKA